MSHPLDAVLSHIKGLDACAPGVAYLEKNLTVEEARAKCVRVDWLIFFDLATGITTKEKVLQTLAPLFLPLIDGIDAGIGFEFDLKAAAQGVLAQTTAVIGGDAAQVESLKQAVRHLDSVLAAARSRLTQDALNRAQAAAFFGQAALLEAPRKISEALEQALRGLTAVTCESPRQSTIDFWASLRATYLAGISTETP